MDDKPQYSDDNLQTQYTTRLRELEAEYELRRAELHQRTGINMVRGGFR